MYKEIVRILQEGRSPFLFTGIEGDSLGKTAVWDLEKPEQPIGDVSLLLQLIENCPGDNQALCFSPKQAESMFRKTPIIQNGVLAERIVTAPRLVLCGGGHVSMQAAKVAALCGFSVTVIDERADFANQERFPDADCILTQPFEDALSSIMDPNAYYVIVTRGHKDDQACLERILSKPFAYCGMIGSRTKVGLVFESLLQKSFPQSLISRVHAPIGISIGAVTPEEIAVSIVAEMIQIKNAGATGVAWDEPLCRAIQEASQPYAFVTLIGKTGSAPRSTGARMIVRPDGSIISSIGGGFGEYEAIQYALDMLQNSVSVKRYTCHMTNRDAAEAGMICGGTVDVMIQRIEE